MTLVEKIADITARELQHHTIPIQGGREITCSPSYFGEHIAPKIKKAILADPSTTYTPPIGNPKLGDIKTHK